MWPRSGPTATRGSSTTAGTPTASRCSPARRSSGSCRPTPSCRATTPTCPAWDSLSPDARRLAARMMEVFAGFLSHTDHHIGRLLDFLRGDRRARQHPDHGGLRQRRQRRRRGHRDHQRDAVLQQRARAAGGQPQARSTSSAARPPSTTTRGAGPGPATRRSGGGSGRPTAAARATRSWSTGRPASAPAARSATSTPTSSTWSRPCSTRSGSSRRPPSGASPSRRCTGSASPTPSTTPAAPTRHHTQYFEMFGHRAIDHDGWRAVCPWPGPSFAEAGEPFGTPITRRDRWPTSTPTAGSSTTSPRTSAENHNVAERAPRQADRADRPVVRRGRQVRRAADRRQRRSSA